MMSRSVELIWFLPGQMSKIYHIRKQISAMDDNFQRQPPQHYIFTTGEQSITKFQRERKIEKSILNGTTIQFSHEFDRPSSTRLSDNQNKIHKVIKRDSREIRP